MKLMTLLAVFCLWLPRAAGADTPSINVGGEAVVRVVPDKITIHFGIETWDKDIQAAKRENNSILTAALKTIAGSGVEPDDVQTDHLSIEPRYKNGYEKENFIGYFVRNAFSVVVDDPERVEGIITSVLAVGVTHIHGVQFETTEFKKHREEARRLALLAAREKAQKMAAVLGLEIAGATGIQEGRGSYDYFGSGWGFRGRTPLSQNVMQDAAGSSDVTDTLALGKIAIRGSVSVQFELREPSN